MDPTPSRALTAVCVIVAGLLCGVEAQLLHGRPSALQALTWGPALDPPPPAAPRLAADVDPAIAALLTADDVARGLAALGAQPADSPLALSDAQRALLSPRLEQARERRARVSMLQGALPRQRSELRAAWRAAAEAGLDLGPTP